MAGRARAIVAIGTLVIGVALPAGAAHADPAGDFFADTNALRASKDVAALGRDGRMVAIAQNWAARMASTQTLAHTPDLPNEIPSDCEKYGENVGTGPTVDAIEQAFVKSPHHYANLVDPDFEVVGIAVVTDSRGALWVAEDFLLEARVPPPQAGPAQTGPATSPTTTTTTTTVAPSAGDVATRLSGLDARS